MWMKCQRNLRVSFLRVRRLKGHPGKVAGGVAIGVFLAMTPTVPLQTVLAVLVAFLFRQSKLAAIFALLVNNPISMPFIYLLDYKLGQVVTGGAALDFSNVTFSISRLINLGWSLSYPLLIGGLITGLIGAIPAYFLTRRLILHYRQQRLQRLKNQCQICVDN